MQQPAREGGACGPRLLSGHSPLRHGAIWQLCRHASGSLQSTRIGYSVCRAHALPCPHKACRSNPADSIVVFTLLALLVNSPLLMSMRLTCRSADSVQPRQGTPKSQGSLQEGLLAAEATDEREASAAEAAHPHEPSLAQCLVTLDYWLLSSSFFVIMGAGFTLLNNMGAAACWCMPPQSMLIPSPE